MSTEQRFTVSSLDKALSICRTLDDHPEAWPVYGETIRDYFHATRSTLQAHYERVDRLIGAARKHKDGTPIALCLASGTTCRSARRSTCATWARE